MSLNACKGCRYGVESINGMYCTELLRYVENDHELRCLPTETTPSGLRPQHGAANFETAALDTGTETKSEAEAPNFTKKILKADALTLDKPADAATRPHNLTTDN